MDSRTIDPVVLKELAKVEKMGAVFMDALVSGGVEAAQSGHHTYTVGGAKDEFAAAQKLLGAWAPMWCTVELWGPSRLQRSAMTCC